MDGFMSDADRDEASFLHHWCFVLTSPRRRRVMEQHWCCWPTNWTGQTGDKWRPRWGRGSQRCSTFEYSNEALQWFTSSPDLGGLCSNTRRCFMSAVPKLGTTLRKSWRSSPGMTSHLFDCWSQSLQHLMGWNLWMTRFYVGIPTVDLHLPFSYCCIPTGISGIKSSVCTFFFAVLVLFLGEIYRL